MASTRYRRWGKNSLWSYEVRKKGKVIAHNSGFKTKKEAMLKGEAVAQKVRSGGKITRDMALVELYQV